MDRNWDWEDIGREMKADEEKREAQKKAEQAKRIEREKVAAVYEYTAQSMERQKSNLSHSNLTDVRKDVSAPAQKESTQLHHNLTVNKSKTVQTAKSEPEDATTVTNTEQEQIKEVATKEVQDFKELRKDEANPANEEGNKKKKEKTDSKIVANTEQMQHQHRKERNEKFYQEANRKTKKTISKADKKKRKKRKKKSGLFRNLVLLYIAVLTVLAVLVLKDVYNTLMEMQDQDPIRLVENRIHNLTDEELASLFESNSAYENPEISIKNIRDYVNSGNLTIQKCGTNEYEVSKDGNKLFVAGLKVLKTNKKYLIFNYDLLEFESLRVATDGELYHYEITAPSFYQITVNGREIGTPAKSVPLEGFADVKDIVSLPSTNTYVVDHLTKEPDIRITEKGTDISFTLSEKMDLSDAYKNAHSFQSMEEAGIDFNALEFAEKWDLFMTDDLPGRSHGYYELEPYFIEDTEMQKKAYEWATGIDITLTSAHTLANPALTNQQISNVVVYDDNTVSYEAYIEKTMIITQTGQTKLEKFASTIYLVRYEDEWKVANIRGDVGME